MAEADSAAQREDYPQSNAAAAVNLDGKVEVRGQVRKPGVFDFVSGSTLQDYLTTAGGTTFPANAAGTAAKVVLVRQEHGRKRLHTFDLKHSDRFPAIRAGDILIFHGLMSERSEDSGSFSDTTGPSKPRPAFSGTKLAERPSRNSPYLNGLAKDASESLAPATELSATSPSTVPTASAPDAASTKTAQSEVRPFRPTSLSIKSVSPESRNLPAQFLLRQPEILRETKALAEYIKLPQFRRVLNQVISAQQEQHFASLAVLSRYNKEGKSFFSAALAAAYAHYLDSRVLIIDTVNEPQHRTLFLERISPNGNSSSALRGIRPVPAAAAGNSYALRSRMHAGSIDFLTTRAFGDGEFEASDFQIGKFIRTLHSHYDLVMVDTCALENVQPHNVDPIIIAEQTDAALFVTSPASLDHDSLGAVIEELQDYRINLIGAVFNRHLEKEA